MTLLLPLACAALVAGLQDPDPQRVAIVSGVVEDGAFPLVDVVGETMTAAQRLTSAGVVRGGAKFAAT